MRSSAAKKFAPVYSEDNKIDVSIEGDMAVISLSSWVEGLGWCTQKTMRLDEILLGEFQRVAAAAKIRLKHNSSGSADLTETNNVLNFPDISA